MNEIEKELFHVARLKEKSFFILNGKQMKINQWVFITLLYSDLILIYGAMNIFLNFFAHVNVKTAMAKMMVKVTIWM